MEGRPVDVGDYLEVVVVEVGCSLRRRLLNEPEVQGVRLDWQRRSAGFGCSIRLLPAFCAFLLEFCWILRSCGSWTEMASSVYR